MIHLIHRPDEVDGVVFTLALRQMMGRFWVTMAATLALLGCSDATGLGRNQEGMPVTVRMSASLGSVQAAARQSGTAELSSIVSAITGVVLEVKGPGIPVPLVFNLGEPDINGEVQAVVTLPAGSDRVMTARAYIGTVVSHVGSDTVDVRSSGVSVNLFLKKVTGDSGVGVTVEDFLVDIDTTSAFTDVPEEVWVERAGSYTLYGRVRYATSTRTARRGDPVEGAVVSWGIENPGFGSLTAASCTTNAEGFCSVELIVGTRVRSGQSTGVVASSVGIADRVVLRLQ